MERNALTKCSYCKKPVRQTSGPGKPRRYDHKCNRCNNNIARYGLNSVEVDWIYFYQDGICANPGCSSKATDLDHCHKTNKVRDMLCHDCNIAYGQLREDPQKIAGLLQYLSTHV